MANCSYRCDEPFSFLRIRAGPSDRRPARQSAKSAEKSDSPEESERRKENEHVPQPRTIGSIRRAQVSLHGVIKSQDDDAIDSAAKPCKPCAQKFHRCNSVLVEMRSDHAGQSRIVMGEINRGANSQQQK